MTRIEWADEVWNPVTGCTPISEGCDHCYARRMAARLAGRCGYDKRKPFAVTWHENKLFVPARWKKPRRIFTCSMGDLFHGDVRVEWIDRILNVIASCPQHRFLLLTKRPGNIRDKLYGEAPARFLADGQYLSNLWLGVTAENQKRANERMVDLLEIPAAVRFLSYEPALGPLDLNAREWLIDKRRFRYTLGRYLDWVICGGETGPGARPVHPDWVRSLRDQCAEAGVPFFFKHWGEWAQRHDLQANQPGIKGRLWHTWDPDTSVCRVGKKPAGRLLDGREWNEVPS